MKQFYIKYRKLINGGIKVLFAVLFVWGIYHHTIARNDFENIVEQYKKVIDGNKYLWLFTLVGLMIFNWLIEALKWKFIIKKVYSISILKSYMAILAGLSFSMFTPNRIGEFAGRVILLDTTKKLRIILLTIVGSFSQTLTTLIFGMAGLLYFLQKFYKLSYYTWLSLVFLGVVLVVVLLLIYLNISIFHSWIRQKGLFKKLIKYTRVLKILDLKSLVKVMGYSVFRYLVFTVQYLLLLHIFEIPFALFDGFMIISAIFLAQMALPLVAILEVFKRGAIAIGLLSFLPFYANASATDQGVWDLKIISAAAGLWLVNLMLPSIAGALVIFRVNILKSLGKWER